ncbi:MAG: hypothetical protein KC502_09855 [Myxococcales bacterium]|nr:hypothetical protein [Myxococcales bacterium]
MAMLTLETRTRWRAAHVFLSALVALAGCGDGAGPSTKTDAAHADVEPKDSAALVDTPASQVDAQPEDAGPDDAHQIDTPLDDSLAADASVADTAIDEGKADAAEAGDASVSDAVAADAPQGDSGASAAVPTLLCAPCATSSDCDAGSVCLRYGPVGAFCAGPCSAGCPKGYGCQPLPVESPTAGAANQAAGCVRLQADGALGICECSTAAVQSGNKTDCWPASLGNQPAKLCVGKRGCTTQGLAACSSSSSPETCNGQDDDCDGETDESGADCDDGNVCTKGDACSDGACQPGAAVACKDNDPCTIDACDIKLGCVHTPTKGVTTIACSDGDPCTKKDTCTDGKCKGAQQLDCDDDNPCTKDSCNAKAAKNTPACVHTKLTDSKSTPAPCDDGSACTGKDSCKAGVCTGGKQAPCGDGNPCTTAHCDAKTGCTNKPNAGPCDDGDPCTHQDKCGDKGCKGGLAADCNDDNPCTADGCSVIGGKASCVHAANGAACDDGNGCTKGDTCKGTVCLPGAVSACDDNNACSIDSCKPGVGCVSVPGGKSCDDGDLCTQGESCKSGACVGGAQVTCDDNNPCTADACSPGAGCVFAHKSAACDDGNACTQPDVCKGGGCKSGAAVDCSDKSPCTLDSCDTKTGKCVHQFIVASDGKAIGCDDGNACTQSSVCKSGVCLSGKPLVCQDNNPCTTDLCDKASGCVYAAKTASGGGKVSCNDSNACTFTACSKGKCVISGLVACDDGKPCTADTCDPTKGCTSTATDGPCSDSSVCTVGDTCSKGACVPGKAQLCDDKNPCTSDTCDKAKGCVHLALTTGANTKITCDDGSKCTGEDSCKNGQCVPGAKTVCDDNNPCTTEFCDPSGGCKPQHNTAPCSDGDACTVGDTCQKGSCKPGVVNSCSDGNPCTAESCDKLKGCIVTTTSAKCDDGNVCTQGDTCAKGKCSPGKPVVCNDNNPCTTDACDAKKGCVAQPNALPCDDGDACTTKDTCNQAACKAMAVVSCDDSNPCTTDGCKPKASGSLKAGCHHAHNALKCDDSNPCTLSDTCAKGACVAGTPKGCDDGNACTVDSCDPKVKGGCVAVPGTMACSDGDACTVGDKCASGSCKGGGALKCDDGNPCTTDGCAKASGCVHGFAKSGVVCAGAKACTLAATCDGKGACAAAAAKTCDDNNPCTTDSCNPKPSSGAAGCVFTNNTLPCCDDSLCTTRDICSGGKCIGAAFASGSGANGSLPVDLLVRMAGDGTGAETASKLSATGTPAGYVSGVIDKAMAFGGKSLISFEADKSLHLKTYTISLWLKLPPGTSRWEAAVAKEDHGRNDPWNNRNFSVFVRPENGVVHIGGTGLYLNGSRDVRDNAWHHISATHDGAALRLRVDGKLEATGFGPAPVVSDKQRLWVGAYGPSASPTRSTLRVDELLVFSRALPACELDALRIGQPGCDDGDVCTDDSCDPTKGCQHKANTAACTDGDVCTTKDACKAGSCQGGPAKVCDDGNVCTDDNCDSQKGCAPKPNSKSCPLGGSAVGACSAGTCAVKTCAAGSYDIDGKSDNGCEYLCKGDPNALEICNGIDDDCDAQTDEIADKVCEGTFNGLMAEAVWTASVLAPNLSTDVAGTFDFGVLGKHKATAKVTRVTSGPVIWCVDKTVASLPLLHLTLTNAKLRVCKDKDGALTGTVLSAALALYKQSLAVSGTLTLGAKSVVTLKIATQLKLGHGTELSGLDLKLGVGHTALTVGSAGAAKGSFKMGSTTFDPVWKGTLSKANTLDLSGSVPGKVKPMPKTSGAASFVLDQTSVNLMTSASGVERFTSSHRANICLHSNCAANYFTVNGVLNFVSPKGAYWVGDMPDIKVPFFGVLKAFSLAVASVPMSGKTLAAAGGDKWNKLHSVSKGVTMIGLHGLPIDFGIGDKLLLFVNMRSLLSYDIGLVDVLPSSWVFVKPEQKVPGISSMKMEQLKLVGTISPPNTVKLGIKGVAKILPADATNPLALQASLTGTFIYKADKKSTFDLLGELALTGRWMEPFGLKNLAIEDLGLALGLHAQKESAAAGAKTLLSFGGWGMNGNIFIKKSGAWPAPTLKLSDPKITNVLMLGATYFTSPTPLPLGYCITLKVKTKHLCPPTPPFLLRLAAKNVDSDDLLTVLRNVQSNSVARFDSALPTETVQLPDFKPFDLKVKNFEVYSSTHSAERFGRWFPRGYRVDIDATAAGKELRLKGEMMGGGIKLHGHMSPIDLFNLKEFGVYIVGDPYSQYVENKDGWLIVSDDPRLGVSQGSLELRAKPPKVPPAGWQATLLSHIDTNNGYALRLGSANALGKTRVTLELRSSGKVYKLTTTKAVVPPGTWSHLAVSFGDGRAGIYVNGELQESTAVGTFVAPGDASAALWAGKGLQAFDDVRIWKSQRTPADIASWQTQLPQDIHGHPDLVGRWSFDWDQANKPGATAYNTRVYPPIKDVAVSQMHGVLNGQATPRVTVEDNGIEVHMTLPMPKKLEVPKLGLQLRMGAKMVIPVIGEEWGMRVWASVGDGKAAGNYFSRPRPLLTVPFWGKFSSTGNGPNLRPSDADDGVYGAIDLIDFKLSGSSVLRFTPKDAKNQDVLDPEKRIDFAGADLLIGCPPGKTCKTFADYRIYVSAVLALAAPLGGFGNVGLFGKVVYDSLIPGMIIDGKLAAHGWDLLANKVKLTSKEVSLTASVNLGEWTFLDLVKITLGSISLQLKLDFAEKSLCGTGNYKQQKSDEFAETFDCAIGVCFHAGGFTPKFGCGTHCLADEMCASDKTCYLGVCADKKGIDAVCTKDTNCASGNCWGGFCRACSPAKKNGCKNGEFCNNTGACETKLPFGAACVGVNKGMEHAWCASGKCDTTCVACFPPGHPGFKASGDTCTADKFCADNGACQARLGGGESCFSTEISTGIHRRCKSSDCGDPTWTCRDCNVNGKTCPTTSWCYKAGNYCKPKLADGAGCGAPIECVSGLCDLYCYTKGATAYGGACKVHAACTTGQCLAAGTCGCNGKDTNCSTGQFCDALGKCVVKLGDGVSCSSPSHCKSGLCDLYCYTKAAKSYGESCKVHAECNTKQCLASNKCGCNGTHANCPSGQFCDKLGSCVAKLKDGTLCSEAAVCASGVCDGYCYTKASKNYGQSCKVHAECKTLQCLATNTCGCNGTDANCGAGQFCNLLGGCATTLGNGLLCKKPNQCTSGHCSTVCVACTADSHCGDGNYCYGGACYAKVGLKSFCAVDNACKSGHCAGICVSCKEDSHCGAGNYCYKNTCYTKVGLGQYCAVDNACTSGQCAGTCVECKSSSKCTGGNLCLSYKCQKLPDGAACTKAENCAGGACNLYCYKPKSKSYGQSCKVHAECNTLQCLSDNTCGCNGTHANCGKTQYCGGLGWCLPKVADGVGCGVPEHCQSGTCSQYCYTANSKIYGKTCKVHAECTTGQCLALGTCGCNGSDAPCGPTLFCNALGSCVSKLGNGVPCGKGSQCIGGHCSTVCASCLNDGHCGSGNYCYAGTCYGKVDLGVFCAVDNACKSGHCFVTCVECKENKHCSSNLCVFNKCVK